MKYYMNEYYMHVWQNMLSLSLASEAYCKDGECYSLLNFTAIQFEDLYLQTWISEIETSDYILTSSIDPYK